MNIKMKTERLTIRYIVEEDWPSIQAIWKDFNKTEYVIYDTVKNTDNDVVKEKVSKWAEANWNSEAHIFLAVCLETKVIGFISLNKRTEGYEIGYGFSSIRIIKEMIFTLKEEILRRHFGDSEIIGELKK